MMIPTFAKRRLSKVSYITTLAAAFAAAKGIAAYRTGKAEVRSLQSYHHDIK